MPIRKDRKRNPEATRAAILQAALEEFSDEGLSGARVDRIAARAGASKPMIYEYFGDKSGVYAAALREAYLQIRQGEAALELDLATPEAAIRRLIHFTLGHYRDNPWFIRMLNTENLLGGATVQGMEDVAALQSLVLDRLGAILTRGARDGCFTREVTARDLYILIAALCWFPISNQHTLRAAFAVPIDNDWLNRHAETSAEMVLGYLRG